MAAKSKSLCGNYTRSKEYINLRKDMTDDLEARGLISKPYMDMIDEYMNLWCLRRMLDEDIAERGVYVEYQNGANQKGTTDNKSVEKRVRVSSQMVTIWAALGFREQANNARPVGGDDDEL